MAQTVIANYSAELAQTNPPNYAPLKPNQLQGRMRIMTFTRVYASEAAGDNTALGVLPAGARIIMGEAHMSASGGSTTFAFGLAGKDLSGFIDKAGTVSDGNALLLAAQTITTTAAVRLAATYALSCMYETEKQVWLTVTTAAATIGTQTLRGWIAYVVD